MIPADQWRAYNEAVDALCDDARSEVSSAISSWLAGHPGATVAEAREEAKRVMRGAVQRADQAAAALAAEWYDSQGRAAGAGLDRAVTEVVYTAADVDKLARYQAGRLVDGDAEGFAKACGDFAVDNAKRSLNATILANAKRDRGRGVRFARVTSGRNTCAFCLMLAGRGAVYWSRETAGAFNHWHTHCSCKIVPGYSGNAYEVLVEGHDPRAAQRWVGRIDSAKQTRIKVQGLAPDIKAECDHYDEALDDAWKKYKAAGKTSAAYRSVYASVVEGLVPENPIRIEDFTDLKGKELQEAVWLARAGIDVTLRNPDVHKLSDGNTSDAFFWGGYVGLQEGHIPQPEQDLKEHVSKG